MVRLIAIFKKPPDPEAFDKYYETVHKPLAAKIPRVVEYRTSKVYGSVKGDCPFYFMAELCFNSKEDLEAALASPESIAAGRDVRNFAKNLVERFFIEDAFVPAGRKVG